MSLVESFGAFFLNYLQDSGGHGQVRWADEGCHGPIGEGEGWGMDTGPVSQKIGLWMILYDFLWFSVIWQDFLQAWLSNSHQSSLTSSQVLFCWLWCAWGGLIERLWMWSLGAWVCPYWLDFWMKCWWVGSVASRSGLFVKHMTCLRLLVQQVVDLGFQPKTVLNHKELHCGEELHAFG